jgi:hypothetical protein
MMDAGINNVIYMELYSGPKMANGICGKTIDTGTIYRGSTVFLQKRKACKFCGMKWHKKDLQVLLGSFAPAS